MTRPTPLLDPCALPPTLDIVTAGRMLGIGRTTAYHLARYAQFPVPVLRIGGNYRVPTTPLLTLLGIDKPTSAPPTASSGSERAIADAARKTGRIVVRRRGSSPRPRHEIDPSRYGRNQRCTRSSSRNSDVELVLPDESPPLTPGVARALLDLIVAAERKRDGP